jgi:hypothetical protein
MHGHIDAAKPEKPEGTIAKGAHPATFAEAQRVTSLHTRQPAARDP